jgi:selenoprotein W-related protein
LRKLTEKTFDITLVPGSGGVFEVEVDGRLIYSKRQTGEHADPDRLIEEVRQL